MLNSLAQLFVQISGAKKARRTGRLMDNNSKRLYENGVKSFIILSVYLILSVSFSRVSYLAHISPNKFIQRLKEKNCKPSKMYFSNNRNP